MLLSVANQRVRRKSHTFVIEKRQQEQCFRTVVPYHSNIKTNVLNVRKRHE